MRVWTALAWLLLLASTAGAGSPAAAGREPSARKILSRMAEVYATCDTYRDEGVVTTVFITDERTWTSERPFATAFVRPDRFRYEYSQVKDGRPSQEYIIWSDGDEVRSWFYVNDFVEICSSLGLAIGNAVGVSGGSSNTVPALLLPSRLRGWRLSNVSRPERLGVADLEGVECYRIQGGPADSRCVIWIERASHLLRRIEEQREFPDFRTEETTDYHPVLDGPVADELLELAAPTSVVREAQDSPPRSLSGVPEALITLGSLFLVCVVIGIMVFRHLARGRARRAKLERERSDDLWPT